ncbi:MAG: histidine phosphatase family protein [Ruminococcaceae bacterium]|nr:histidine phosphatase family protein [Oscillospiraceae bacterium]
MKLYLARHGESEGNLRDIFYGHLDLPLTEKGKQDAKIVGEKLSDIEIAHCYTSPLCRASETAEIALAGRDVPITVCDDFIEQHMGEYEGIPFEALYAKMGDEIFEMLRKWPDVILPGGETFFDVKCRVENSIGEIVKKGEDSLIVAHFGSLSAIFSCLLALPNAVTGVFSFDHGCISCIEIDEKWTRLLFFNR